MRWQALVGRRVELIPGPRFDEENSTRRSGIPRPQIMRRPPYGYLTLLVVAASAAVTSGVVTWWQSRPAESSPPREAFSLALPANHDLIEFAISPDGTTLVYAAVAPRAETENDDETASRVGLYLRRLDSFAVQPLAGTHNATQPFFSHDGTRVGFFAEGFLKWMTLDGELPADIIRVRSHTAGASWTADDRIVFATLDGRGLQMVSVRGDEGDDVEEHAITTLTTLDENADEISHGWPHVLPDGQSIVFTVGRRDRDARLAWLTLESQEYDLLWPADGGAFYVESVTPSDEDTGALVFVRRSEVFALPVDIARHEVTGPVQAIADGVAGSAAGYARLGRSTLVAARTGRLAYTTSTSQAAQTQLTWVDRMGHPVDVDAIEARHEAPRVAPDGSKIVVAIRQGPFSRDLWEYDTATGTRRQLTSDAGDNHSPVWTPDGRHVTFASNRDGPQGLYQLSPSEPLTVETLLAGDTRTPGSWGRDGRTLFFHESSFDRQRDVWLWDALDGAESPRLLIGTPANERAPAISPDGRWLAYVSDREDGDQVYIRAYPEGAARRISTTGGAEPVWSKDGLELFYRRGRHLFVMNTHDVNDMATVDDERLMSRQLFAGSFVSDPGGHVPSYDVSPDGTRFVMLRPTSRTTEISVLTGWTLRPQ